jgi:hypothetical protein
MKAPSAQFVECGECPCGQKIYASKEALAVAHELPYCQEFMGLEADEFLAFVRRSRGIGEA